MLGTLASFDTEYMTNSLLLTFVFVLPLSQRGESMTSLLLHKNHAWPVLQANTQICLVLSASDKN